jgi:ATP-binding cassette subfamily B protein
MKDLSGQKNRINVMIAHRIRTIMYTDCIFLFEEGKIIENGTHEELIDFQGLCNVMW